jgi:hypothetical protein
MTLRSIPTPKLVHCLRAGYSLDTLAHDLVAGLTVGLVALPLAMAFAIASGVPPQNGTYCAVIAGFAISALGGSRVQIGGPTGAFVVVVSAIVTAHGIDGLFMCTLMAGVITTGLDRPPGHCHRDGPKPPRSVPDASIVPGRHARGDLGHGEHR